MPYFSVKTDALRTDVEKLNEIFKKLNELGSHCDTIERTLDNQAAALIPVKSAIKSASAQLQRRGSSVGELYRKLDQIANVYEKAEKRILNSGDMSKSDISKLKDKINEIIQSIKDYISKLTFGRDETTDRRQ